MGLSTATQFFGDRVWTPADIDEAIGDDEDWCRYEIVDGVLVVSPHAVVRHQLVATGLIQAIGTALPDGYLAMGSLGIVLGRSYRVSDATVVDSRILGRDEGMINPADVLLVVEIESPSSITTDRVTKPAQYAAAGIEHYWRVEMDPLRLHIYRLADGVYEQTGEWDSHATARITDPFEVEIDLAALLPA